MICFDKEREDEILFLTVVRTMNRCNPSIYAGYSDFGFRNEIW